MGDTLNFPGTVLGLEPIKLGIKEYSVGTRSITNPTERVDVGYNAALGGFVAVQRTTNSPTIDTNCGCFGNLLDSTSALNPEGYRLSVGSSLKSYYDFDVEFNGVIPSVDVKSTTVNQSIFNVGFIDRFGNTITTNLIDPNVNVSYTYGDLTFNIKYNAPNPTMPFGAGRIVVDLPSLQRMMGTLEQMGFVDFGVFDERRPTQGQLTSISGEALTRRFNSMSVDQAAMRTIYKDEGVPPQLLEQRMGYAAVSQYYKDLGLDFDGLQNALETQRAAELRQQQKDLRSLFNSMMEPEARVWAQEGLLPERWYEERHGPLPAKPSNGPVPFREPLGVLSEARLEQLDLLGHYGSLPAQSGGLGVLSEARLEGKKWREEMGSECNSMTRVADRS